MYFEKLCSLFEKLDETEALVLGGSRATDRYDEKSDYDLYVYVTAMPSIETRKAILDACCEYTEMNNTFWETEDDCTLKDGIDIDILYRNLDDFENGISDVVDACHSHNGYTTCMWHNLLHSRIIYDRYGRYEVLQKKYDVPYPKELQKNIIANNLRLLTGNLPSYDRQIRKAIRRKDLVSVNHRTAAFLESYFDIIFAMNEMTHPGEKRMLEIALKDAKILPENCDHEVRHLLYHQFGEPQLVPKILENLNTHLTACLKENNLI